MESQKTDRKPTTVYTLDGKLPPSMRDPAKRARIIAQIDVDLGTTRNLKKGKTLIWRLVQLT